MSEQVQLKKKRINKPQSCLICGSIEKPQYGFPTNAELKKKWGEAANVSLDKLCSKSRLCSKHFLKTQIVNIRLRSGSVPCLNLPVAEEMNIVFNPENELEGRTDVVKSIDKSMEKPEKPEYVLIECTELEKMKEQVTNLVRQCTDLSSKYNKLLIENEDQSSALNNMIDNTKASSSSKDFCKMLLHSKNTYNKKQKKLAAAIQYKSSNAYKFLRRKLKFNLPCEDTINKILPVHNVGPGIEKGMPLIKNLEKAIKSFSKKDKIAILVFDEIQIKKELVYNSKLDQIIGLEDIGNGDRTKLLGKHICTFMVRGIFSNWKYVTNYVVTAQRKCLRKPLNNTNINQFYFCISYINFCFSGLKQTIFAIAMLCEEIFNDSVSDVSFLWPYKLNQDGLENFFSVVRQRGGNCRNPSVFQFNQSLTKFSNGDIMTAYSSFKNCEDDFDEFITCDNYVDENSQTMVDSKEIETVCEVENLFRKSKIAKNSSSKNAALRYTVGFTIFKVIGNRLGCHSCLKLMTSNSECKALDETLI